jgi:hypothetical protein
LKKLKKNNFGAITFISFCQLHQDGNYQHNRTENLIAVHCQGHDRLHGGRSNFSSQRSTCGKGQLGEKPDERKLARPVLKPSHGGGSVA